MTHDPNNDDCPLNDPETLCNPATMGIPCTCPEATPEPEDGFDVGTKIKVKVSSVIQDGTITRKDVSTKPFRYCLQYKDQGRVCGLLWIRAESFDVVGS